MNQTDAYSMLYRKQDGTLHLGAPHKTPECAALGVSPFEGDEVLGTVALLPEPVSGMSYRLAAQPLIAELGQEVGAVPSFRGYANLGVGAYLLEHSAEGEDAELCIVPATEAEKAGRTVGDLCHFDGEREPIPAERMAVRLRFDNVAGLDALEQQLRLLREVHFPTSPAHTSEARDAVPVKVPAPRYIDCPCCSSQEDHRHQCMPYFAAMRQEGGE